MPLKTHPEFKNFHELKHPLLENKLALLRDATTSKKLFKELTNEIATMLFYEASHSLKTTNITVKTPLADCESKILSDRKAVILPILRAGLGMVEGVLNLLPTAKVGHIGMYRDEKTLEPHRYYFKIPKDSLEHPFFVCDPMLATGNTAVAAINELKKEGIKQITFLCLVAAPEGVKHFNEFHSEINIFAASLDEGLNDKSYILPGLGDAGDRLFGTT